MNKVIRDGLAARAGSQPPQQHSQVASGGLPVGANGRGGGAPGDGAEAEGEQAALGEWAWVYSFAYCVKGW